MGKTYTAILNVKTNTNPMNSMGNTLNEFTNGMLMPTSMQMAGAAGIGYRAGSIKTSMDFNAQLSAIKSLTPKEGLDGIHSDDVMQRINWSGFGIWRSMTQGMTELIKAGISLKDVLGDASEAALNLATAGD